VRQFRHPEFVDEVMDAHQDRHQPHKLKLELTESLLADDIDVTIAKMRS
jgi:EAL domain-containing protein (putative c-di-GMP-specific phosphodiesterase class I)